MGPGFESLKVHQRVCHISVLEPPVPIPNTEVKRHSAEDTWWATARENRSWQTQEQICVPCLIRRKEFVLLACWNHLYPFRTQKLSDTAPKILGGRLPGKIGQSEHSSLAQLAERMTVNHDVAGSSPAGGAKKEESAFALSSFFTFLLDLNQGCLINGKP